MGRDIGKVVKIAKSRLRCLTNLTQPKWRMGSSNLKTTRRRNRNPLNTPGDGSGSCAVPSGLQTWLMGSNGLKGPEAGLWKAIWLTKSGNGKRRTGLNEKRRSEGVGEAHVGPMMTAWMW